MGLAADGVTAYPCGSALVAYGCTVAAGGPASTSPADYSANAAAVPVSGFTLLTTVPATASRAYCEVQNQSAGTVQVVRDDGNGNAVSTILLAPGGSGQQGGSWSSTTFKGRIRVFGASGAQLSAFED